MQASADPAERAYDAFAPFYDSFTAGSDYDAWTTSVEPVLRTHAPAGRRLLDLACGTGESLLPFHRRGYEVTGCDISAAMLDRARAKAPSLPLLRLDVRALPGLGPFDVLTCFDDSLNYIGSPSELEAAFHSARRNLAPDGLFLFDLNTLAAYRSTFARDSVTERDGLTFVWRGRGPEDAAPGCAAEATIDVLRPAASGLYELIRTRHRQRHHPAAAVTELLERAGLRLVQARGVRPDGSLAAEPDEDALLKTLYVARARKGGEPDGHQEDRQAADPGPVRHEAVVARSGRPAPRRAPRVPPPCAPA
ncbi:MAG TPA: class I SAM-dependent methyltransferase [Thermoleophilaceae bacterium]|nr:class I SAM-dependent methyltransferase [Thermoleophilaceae bacterium]